MKIINFLLNHNIDHIISGIIVFSYLILNWKCIMQKLKCAFKYIHLIWYVVLLLSISAYCFTHWNKVIVFTPFSGNSLLFIVMISLLLLPFIIEINIGDNKGTIKNPFEVLEKELQSVSSQAENIAEGESTVKDNLLQSIEKLAQDKGVPNA